MIYFVVRIHKTDSHKRKVFYEVLTPVKLRAYLVSAEKQKTKTIVLKALPSDRCTKISIVVNFLKDCRKQSSFAESGFISLEELRKSKTPHHLEISIVNYGQNSHNSNISSIIGRETYVYVKFEGINAKIPADTPVIIDDLQRAVCQEITVAGKHYYDSCQIIHSAEGTSVKIGDSLTLACGKFDSHTIGMKVSFPPYLRKAAKDMQFLIDAVNAKQFEISAVKLNFFDESINDFVLSTQKRLVDYRRMIALLDILNVNDDLYLDGLTKDQKNNIEILIKTFIDKKEITNITTKTRISVTDLKISNIVLKLILWKNENGTHTIHDFFNSDATFWYNEKDKNGTPKIASPYSALSKDDYLIVSNINYDKIIDSYKKVVALNLEILDQANLDMLQMLLAYDERPDARLLGVAKDIVLWISAEDKNNSNKINTLNHLQIIRRERALNTDEKKLLCEIAEDISTSEQEKTGAYLLLNNQVLAEIHFNRLTKEEQEVFMSFPIYKFWTS